MPQRKQLACSQLFKYKKCAEQDSNLRRPKSRDLQSRAFDRSAIDACAAHSKLFHLCVPVFYAATFSFLISF